MQIAPRGGRGIFPPRLEVYSIRRKKISITFFYFRVGPVRTFVINGQLLSLILACLNCAMYFKLGMVIPETVKYNVDSEATIQ